MQTLSRLVLAGRRLPAYVRRPFGEAPLPDIATLQADLASRYLIERELGRGGMATVYLAQDLKHERPVALKVLHPELSSNLGSERFQREIKLAARLQHPHILTVLDSGETGSTDAGTRRLWFTMPFVEGETLRTRIVREGQLPVASALRVVREVAQALQYAHARGVIHRDIKPENLLLTGDGSTLVADFGIARQLGETVGGPERLTETGLSIGTPVYMSPEQGAGDRHVDGRTDTYSLGCVLFEMLTGEPPYTGSTAQAVIVKRFTEPVPSVRRLRPEVPAAVEQALQTALAREPHDRFASADAFAAALVAAPAAPAAPPTPASPPPPKPRSVAVLPFLSLSPDPADEFFADGITEDVIAQLSKIRSLSVISRSSAMQFKERERNVREIGATLRVGSLLQGSVRHAGDRVRIVAQLADTESEQNLWVETYDRQLTDIFQIQSDVALRIAGALQAELSRDEQTRIGREPTRDIRAYRLFLQGRQCCIQYSEEGIRKGIKFFEQAIAVDPQYAMAYTGIAKGYADLVVGQGSTLLPDETIRRAKAAAAKALELDGTLGDAHAVLALLKFVFDFDWAGGEAELKLALELSPGSADIYDYYGWFCGALERYDEALAMVTRAEELDPLAHKSDVAGALMRAGRYEDARKAAERGVELDPTFPRVHSTLGWAFVKLGMTARGVAALEESVRLSPGDTLFLGQLAQAYGIAGQPDRARAVLRQMDELSRGRYVSPYHFAYGYVGLGESDRAMDYLERAARELAGGVFGIKGSFLFASLHSHPRFQALLRQMNLA